MYHNKIRILIENLINGNMEKRAILDYLIDNFDCDIIYDSDDELIIDAFFSLKHYASGEENVSDEEWLYFLNCLDGKIKYNLSEKLNITTKNRNC